MFSIGLAALAALVLARQVAPAAAEPFPDIPRLPTAVAMFWCGLGKSDCEISCTIGGVTKTFSGLHAARVQTYPGSDKLWLEMNPAPNGVILLGDALCDFSKIPVARPIQ